MNLSPHTIELHRQVYVAVRLMHCRRIDISTEKAAQAEIDLVLRRDGGLTFSREHRLSAQDIPGFFFPDTGLAIEVKIKGARKRAVHAQLCRYAAHDAVRGLLLITGLSMGLPEEIGSKPVWYASLGRAWL